MHRGIHKFSSFTALREAHPSVPSARGRIYKGVTLIKSGMGNKRDRNYYPPEVLKAGVNAGIFESLRAFADHPNSVDEEIQPERTIRDMCGIYENTRYDTRENAVKADLRVLKSHKWLSDTIDELIECGHGDKIGLSINGRGQTEPARMRLEEAGNEEVEVNRLQQFIELRSVDVVTEAGAGGGFISLLESARRARETQMGIKELYAALREAARKGDLKEAKAIETKIAAIETQDEAETKSAKTKEGFMPRKRGKKMSEATEDEDEAVAEDEDADEQVEDTDEVAEAEDHDAELDDATEDAKDGTDPDDLEEADEDGEDEGEDDEEPEEGDDAEPTRESDGRPGYLRYADQLRERRLPPSERLSEAGRVKIRGGTGKPTGSVTSGGGRFTKPAKYPSKKSPVAKPKRMKVVRYTGGATREAAHNGPDNLAQLREHNRRLREKNARLSEALGQRASADLAKKLLRESNLPPSVRPTLVRDLIGLSAADMRAKIHQQERILDALRESAVADLSDGQFERVEGAGSTLREARFGGGSRGNGDDLADVFEDLGIAFKA